MNSKRTQVSTTLPYLAVIPLIILGILSILATGDNGGDGIPPLPPGQQFDCASGDVDCLINAINTANADAATINLVAGTYTLTVVDNITDAPNGLPSITSPITITGAAADSTITITAAEADTTIIEPDAISRFRIFHVAVGGSLAIDQLTLRKGGTFSDSGGGIRNSGTLIVSNSTISAGDAGFGGAIANFGTAIVSNSTFTGDGSLAPDAGALYNAGTMTVRNSLISGHSAEGRGGGIGNIGTLTIIDSTISDNAADDGGGIINWIPGTLGVIDSTISGNFAAEFGGGIINLATLSITNSTISGNFAQKTGGDISNSGTLTVSNSTVTDNYADVASGGGGDGGGGISLFLFDGDGTVELTHTIVAGNSSDTGPPDCSAAIISLGHNLLGAGTGCPSDGPSDQAVDPTTVFTTVLGPLQDNGGPTETHNLLLGSPAIDIGEAVCNDADGAPLTTDQRGLPRPVDGNNDSIVACDIGAVEFQP